MAKPQTFVFGGSYASDLSVTVSSPYFRLCDIIVVEAVTAEKANLAIVWLEIRHA